MCMSRHDIGRSSLGEELAMNLDLNNLRIQVIYLDDVLHPAPHPKIYHLKLFRKAQILPGTRTWVIVHHMHPP